MGRGDMAGPTPGHVAAFPECSLAARIGKFAVSQCGEVASSAMGCKKIWPLLAACAAREAKKEIGKRLRSVLFSVRPERAGHKRLFSFPLGCVSTLGGEPPSLCNFLRLRIWLLVSGEARVRKCKVVW